MRLYAGCDLHAKSNYWGIVDGEGKRVFKKKVGNDGERILGMLEGFRGDLEGVVVESTFNWYWLVDLLMDEGYRVYLANPTKMQKYSGLKYGDDEDDAFWLAEMLRLGILPVGYIYPKESRPMRDLLRKRAHLVRMRTSALLSWQNILSRNVGGRGRRTEEKGRKLREWRMGLLESEDLVLAGRVSEEDEEEEGGGLGPDIIVEYPEDASDEEVEAYEEAFRLWGQAVFEEVIRRTPVRTGKLIGSIRLSDGETPGTTLIAFDCEYAPIVERGRGKPGEKYYFEGRKMVEGAIDDLWDSLDGFIVQALNKKFIVREE